MITVTVVLYILTLFSGGEFEADLTHVWFLKNLSCTQERIQKLTTNDWVKIEEWLAEVWVEIFKESPESNSLLAEACFAIASLEKKPSNIIKKWWRWFLQK